MKRISLLLIIILVFQGNAQTNESGLLFSISPSASMSIIKLKDFDKSTPQLNYNLRLSATTKSSKNYVFSYELVLGKASGKSEYTSKNISYQVQTNLYFGQVNAYILLKQGNFYPKFGAGYLTPLKNEDYTYQIYKDGKLIYNDSTSFDKAIFNNSIGFLAGFEYDLHQQFRLNVNSFVTLFQDNTLINLSFGIKYNFN